MTTTRAEAGRSPITNAPAERPWFRRSPSVEGGRGRPGRARTAATDDIAALFAGPQGPRGTADAAWDRRAQHPESCPGRRKDQADSARGPRIACGTGASGASHAGPAWLGRAAGD